MKLYLGDCSLSMQKDASECYMVGSLNPCNLGRLIVGGIIPSSATRIGEYITDYMDKNDGKIPENVTPGYLSKNKAFLDRHKLCVRRGDYLELPPVQWNIPYSQFGPLPSKLIEWIEGIRDNYEPGNRYPGIMACSKGRARGKSSFFAQIVGHPVGDNDFGKNPRITYINGMATASDFDKENSVIMILDDFQGWQNNEDFKNVMTGQSTGLNIKGTVTRTRPMPCVFITNDDEKFKELKNDERFKHDCYFWDVNGFIFMDETKKREVVEFELTENFSLDEKFHMMEKIAEFEASQNTRPQSLLPEFFSQQPTTAKEPSQADLMQLLREQEKQRIRHQNHVN